MRDFDGMAERLENLVKAQSRLLNDISHELRSPLARLNVALGLARQRSGPESATMLERIELEASRLNELIGRLLTLARLEDGEQHVPTTPILLDEVVLNVAEDAEFEAQARHCHVRSEIPAGTWAVRGDASLLHSAIENVVRNAIRYTHEGTTVEIDLEKKLKPMVARKRWSESPIVGPACPPMRWKNCSSRFTAWTMLEAGRPAALAWAWPLRSERCASMAAASPLRTAPRAD